MSSYIIAGSANKPEIGQCEQIANKIKSFYKNIDFRIVIKHPDQWDEHISNILRIYGFKKMYDPIIYTLDGKLIGDIEGFKQLALQKFEIDPQSIVYTITPQINLKIVEKEVALKKKLQKGKKTLAEKIQIALYKNYNEGNIQNVGGIFENVINRGLQFYVKRDERLCPQISIQSHFTPDIVKEVVQAEDINLQKIMQKDYFHQENVEEELASMRSKGSKMIHHHQDSQDLQQILIKQQTNIENTEQTNEPANQEPQENLELQEQVEGAELAEGEINTNNNINNDDNINVQEQQIAELVEDDVFEEHDGSQPSLINLKDFVIKSIKNNYYLSFHPEPKMDGQIIIFESVKNESDPDGIYIKDYSLSGKTRKLKKRFGQPKEVNEEASSEKKLKSGLNKEQLEIRKPLSKVDWKVMKKTLKKLDGIFTLQYLPKGYKNHIPIQNGVLNFYLRKFVINAHENKGVLEYLTEENVKEIEDLISEQRLPFEKYICDNKGQGGRLTKKGDFLEFANLPFPHLILVQDAKKQKIKKPRKQFKSMIKTLFSDQAQLTSGFNFIMTRHFMMLTPLTTPYLEFQGNPLFLSPLSFIGYVHLPVLTPVYPATTYDVSDKRELGELLKVSTA